MMTPAILTATAPGMKLHDEEVFGPVLAIERYDDFEDALARREIHSKFGLQAGLLTHDSRRILTAYRELEVGAFDPLAIRRAGGWTRCLRRGQGFRARTRRHPLAIEELTESHMLVMSGIGLA